MLMDSGGEKIGKWVNVVMVLPKKLFISDFSYPYLLKSWREFEGP